MSAARDSRARIQRAREADSVVNYTCTYVHCLPAAANVTVSNCRGVLPHGGGYGSLSYDVGVTTISLLFVDRVTTCLGPLLADTDSLYASKTA